MSDLSDSLRLSLRILAAQYNLFPNGVSGSEKKLSKILSDIYKGVGDFGLTNKLLQDLRVSLKDKFPSEIEIKNWFMYDEDFSGLVLYIKEGNKFPVATKVIKSIDLSSGYSYHDNRDLVKNIVKEKNSYEKEKLMDELRKRLPKNKIRYLHWKTSNLSFKEGLKLQESYPEYFSNEELLIS